MTAAYVGSGSPLSAAATPTCDLAAAGIRLIRTSALGERPALDRWCSAVGPPARIEGTHTPGGFTGPLTVVSWNVHVGAGDIDAFVNDLRTGRVTGQPVRDFILLLQEAYRGGATVPSLMAMPWASAEPPAGLGKARVEVTAAAERLGLSAVYVPSMRNGKPGVTAEDRGNAILSTLPLADVTGIELPLERQRRVAIAATVRIVPTGAEPRTVRIVCTHFTNMVMHHLWLLSESGRLRQARALAATLPHDGPLIVGGDFNAWFGFRDAAYRELARAVAPPAGLDRRPTFGPLRLDHLLFRLPEGWRAELRRGESKYGSDHYPLVASVDLR